MGPYPGSTGTPRSLEARLFWLPGLGFSSSVYGPSAQSIGALALGAIAVGGMAIGALVVGRLFIGRARIKKLYIDELKVGRLRIREQLPSHPSPPDTAEGN